jgi:hypothetical protein
MREEIVQRISAQGNDEPGMKKGKLQVKPWRASIDLLRQRVTVLRWTTLDYIQYIHFTAREPYTGQKLIQKFARLPHEWPSLLVLKKPRGLTNEHHFCLRVPLPGYGAGSRLM